MSPNQVSPDEEGAEVDRRIERLLADAEAAAGPVAWPRVEALVTALVDLYGRGLEHLLAHARAVAAAAACDLDDRLAEDELVASLLVLHGIHPMPVARRVDRALERVASALPDAAPLVLVEIAERVAVFRVQGDGVPPSTELVARAVEAEAPELAGVRVIGSTRVPRAASDVPLVPVERLVRRGAR